MIQSLMPHQHATDRLTALRHDLKQHIATGLLLSDPSATEDLDERERVRFKVLHQQFEYAAALVAILGDEPPGEASDVDLAELAGEAVEAAAASHDVSLELQSGDFTVHADPVLLHRALANLIDNACRATSSGGRVVVRVGRDPGERWVDVVDDGPGFGEIEPGTGVGLQVVRSAVWACSGRLEIDTGPRIGTSIRLTIPVGRPR